MVIEEFKLGNTTIKVNDEYIDESKTEEILERIKKILSNAERKTEIDYSNK